MSAYVSIRQHTTAYEQADDFEPRLVMLVLEERQKRVLARALEHTSAYVSIRQHTSAYVSIRQHTSAYVS
jgi:hypothetical protein